MTTTPDRMVPRKAARMTPRPKRTPKAAPSTPPAVELAAPPAPPVAEATAPVTPRPAWARYSDALTVLIAHEDDPCERDMLRLKLLEARHTPWSTR